MSQKRVYKTDKCIHEPVGYVTDSGRSAVFYAWVDIEDDTPLYTHPRKWVKITVEDIESWVMPEKPTVFEFVRFVEKKIKEKNP